MLCSLTRRRTTGDNKRLSSANIGVTAAGLFDAVAVTGVAATGAGAGVTATTATGAGADSTTIGSTAGIGAGAGTGAGAVGGGVGCAAGADAAESVAAPTTAIIAPTGTVSPSCARISISTPLLGAGTSVSTLSVDTSNSGSSATTLSPTFLNQRVMVPSVTVSPSWGNVISAIVSSPEIVQIGRATQLLRLRPVSDNIVSPNSSPRLG